jgi:cytochrome c5
LELKINALCSLQSATDVVAARDALDSQRRVGEVSTAPHCKQHSVAPLFFDKNKKRTRIAAGTGSPTLLRA